MMTANHTGEKGYKYIVPISCFFIACYLTSAVLQNRLVAIGHIYICAGIFIYPFSYLIADIVAEVYGYAISRQLVWSGIISWFVLGISTKVSIYLPIPSFWVSYAHDYAVVMGPLLRSILAGTFAVFVGQFLNIYLIAKLKIFMRGRNYWLRNLTSTMVGDVVTVFLAIFGIMYHRIPLQSIFIISLSEITIMIIFSLVMVFPASAIVSFLKISENIDFYDYTTNFNPFRIKLNDTEEDMLAKG